MLPTLPRTSRTVLCLIPVLCMFLLTVPSWGQTTVQVTIPAVTLWVDTGIALGAGKTATVSATGTWNWGTESPSFGPDGDPISFDGFFDLFENFDLADHGRLIAFIGPDPYQANYGNASFFPRLSGYISVGSGQTFTAVTAGELWLGMDDGATSEGTSDNTGQVVATVTTGLSDTTGPAITITSPTDETVYQPGQAVQAQYSCSDPDDAVASCTGAVASGADIDTSITDQGAFTVVATDSSGNTSSKTVTYWVNPVAVQPQFINFETEFAGKTSPVQTITLSNQQDTTLNISSIVAPSNFAQTNNCGTSLAAHTTCTISVTFTPTNPIAYAGELVVNDDQPADQSTGMVGAGTLVRITPARLLFGAQTVGTTSAPMQLLLTNKQSVTLNLASITTTGDFARTTNCGHSLAAGKTCKINVTFTPTAVGTSSGQLMVNGDAYTTPFSVRLNGTGTQ